MHKCCSYIPKTSPPPFQKHLNIEIYCSIVVKRKMSSDDRKERKHDSFTSVYQLDKRKRWKYDRGRKSKKDRQNKWRKEKKRQKNTKHYTKNKDRTTSLKTGVELMCPGTVSCSCSTCGTHHATLVRNPETNHEWGKNQIVITTNGTYPWSFVTYIK